MWNHIIDIISLLVIFDINGWCNCSLIARALDITGKTSWTLQLIVFDNATARLRRVNVATFD